MSNFPDDVDETGYAYVTATTSDYGYGKMKLHLRLSSLARSYPLDPVTITQAAQFGSTADMHMGPEPSYGWHMKVEDHSDGLDINQLDRVQKAVKKLLKALHSVQVASGIATLLEDHLARLIYVSGVKYVYIPQHLDCRMSIPDMDCWLPKRDGMTSVHGRLSFLKRELAKARP